MIKSLNFSLTEKQVKTVNKWCKELIKKYPHIFKEEENRYPIISYIFTPSGIGNGVELFEMHTKEKKEITDYENW